MNIHKHSGSKGKDEDSLPDDLNNDLETYRLSEQEQLSLSDSDIEDALGNVLERIDEDESRSSEPEPGFSFNWKVLSIAASITLLGILTVLSIPVKIEVPHGEITSVDLPDGSSVTLNSGSELSYPRLFNYTGRDVTLSGEGYFEVESDPEDPFTVNTSNSSVKVLGTRFNLSDWNAGSGAKAKLTVTEGSVEFSGQGGNNAIILTENESALISESSQVIPATLELDNMLAWLSNNIAFQSETLTQAFSMLERRFDITIDLDEELILEDENITAFYHDPQDPESIIQDICTIKGLSYRKTHNGFKIIPN